MTLHYPPEVPTEDDEWIDVSIPETFITTIKNDKVGCVPLEGLTD